MKGRSAVDAIHAVVDIATEARRTFKRNESSALTSMDMEELHCGDDTLDNSRLPIADDALVACVAR